MFDHGDTDHAHAEAPRMGRRLEFARHQAPKAIGSRMRKKKSPGLPGGIRQRRNKRWNW